MHEKHPSKIVDVANEYSIQAVGSVQAVALGCCQNWPQELRIWRQQPLGDGMAASLFSVINSLIVMYTCPSIPSSNKYLC